MLNRRDLDQISEDLKSPKHLQQHKSLKAAEDLPGLGQFYCIECAKWFESENSMVTHRKGSTHKRRYLSPPCVNMPRELMIA
jgi:bud site selection protein 20